ncbi:hypothetical protein C408_2602 [Vibrio diabolicus E0666]|nr:hypothetical protein C408_2602 [Vibrio diabolicus E0666]
MFCLIFVRFALNYSPMSFKIMLYSINVVWHNSLLNFYRKR